MVCDEHAELHVTVLHVLVPGKSCSHHAKCVSMTNELKAIGKSECDHWCVLHWTLVTAKLKFDPVHAYLDFEKR